MDNRKYIAGAASGVCLLVGVSAHAGTPIGCGCINPNEIILGAPTADDLCDVDAVSRGYSGGRTRSARPGDSANAGSAPFNGCHEYMNLTPVCFTAGSVRPNETTEATICEAKGNAPG